MHVITLFKKKQNTYSTIIHLTLFFKAVKTLTREYLIYIQLCNYKNIEAYHIRFGGLSTVLHDFV